MSRPKRLRNVSYVGPARYFLTFCVLDRRAVFTHAEVVQRTFEQFLRTATEELFAVIAYCFTPDHTHLLVGGLDTSSDLRRFAKMAKQRSGRLHRRRCRERLWQDGYFDRVLRDLDDARGYARYIINNPVRAGLVASPLDHPFLGCTLWTIEELSDAGSKEQDPAYKAR